MATEGTCPVCNTEVNNKEFAHEYEGEHYAFCCVYCRAQFVEECEADFYQRLADAQLQPPERES